MASYDIVFGKDWWGFNKLALYSLFHTSFMVPVIHYIPLLLWFLPLHCVELDFANHHLTFNLQFKVLIASWFFWHSTPKSDFAFEKKRYLGRGGCESHGCVL